MIEFLKSYGVWIVIGLFFLVTLLRTFRRVGGGRAMSGQQTDSVQSTDEKGTDEKNRHSGCC